MVSLVSVLTTMGGRSMLSRWSCKTCTDKGNPEYGVVELDLDRIRDKKGPKAHIERVRSPVYAHCIDAVMQHACLLGAGCAQ